jgi:hypothetical protein
MRDSNALMVAFRDLQDPLADTLRTRGRNRPFTGNRSVT